MHLLKLLATKGYKISKEKLQFIETEAGYLVHLISAQELYLDPYKLRGILSFPKSKTKCQLQAFLGLAELLSQLDSKLLLDGTTPICPIKNH